MSKELLKSQTLPEEKLAAIKICPDFKLTNSGPYKRNIWTEFAENLILTQPDQEIGFNKDNYQNWLDWTFEMLSRGDHDNPLLEYAKELENEANERFKIPWLLSFEEKNFKFERDAGGWYGVRFKKFSLGNSGFERELIADRFGKPVLLERVYLSGILDDICMVFIDNGQTCLRFDHPELWGFQQRWYRSETLGHGYKGQIKDLARVDGPVAAFISTHRHLIAQNRRLLSVAQS